MATVKIQKKEKTLLVSQTAYDNFYKSAGWKLENASSLASVEEVEEEAVEEPIEEVKEEETEESWDDEDEEVVSKPISEMSNAELKEYAVQLGIDITGLSSNKQLREAIKASM